MQTKTATFNIARDLHQRLQGLAFSKRLSKSSIVEIAIRQFFWGRSDEEIVAELLAHGASLRRRESRVAGRQLAPAPVPLDESNG